MRIRESHDYASGTVSVDADPRNSERGRCQTPAGGDDNLEPRGGATEVSGGGRARFCGLGCLDRTGEDQVVSAVGGGGGDDGNLARETWAGNGGGSTEPRCGTR